ncbi:DeoR/GlpR family DNA-binding transcription regulator [Bacillus alkalicellulosilyticus]|uniref:DeoR/GlpR family DNA-binding transcription regulator n=1 Tax=Alkalihalobacterium alkalicellulosilyticum TaxID=1912214 RepID=UPI0009984E6C|nr:DeoR/GlpR family DNA-binding transcription regulator [Bacillus alkalicellulosilyticus]
MRKETRRQLIESYLLEHGKVEIDELVPILNVSQMTLRRDLMELEKEHKLIRTHGGAVPINGLIHETPYANKESQHIHQKRAIAKKAAAIVKEGNTIILDSGTTSLELARLLKTKENVTVITNDVFIAVELVTSKNHVIVTGGEVQAQIGAMLGPHTESILRDVNVDLFFLGAHAVHQSAGITAPTLEKAKVKKMMINAAKETWLISDSSKFGKKAFASVCSLTDLHGIITDEHHMTDNLHLYHENILTT